MPEDRGRRSLGPPGDELPRPLVFVPRSTTVKPAPSAIMPDEVLADVVQVALDRAEDDHSRRPTSSIGTRSVKQRAAAPAIPAFIARAASSTSGTKIAVVLEVLADDPFIPGDQALLEHLAAPAGPSAEGGLASSPRTSSCRSLEQEPGSIERDSRPWTVGGGRSVQLGELAARCSVVVARGGRGEELADLTVLARRRAARQLVVVERSRRSPPARALGARRLAALHASTGPSWCGRPSGREGRAPCRPVLEGVLGGQAGGSPRSSSSISSPVGRSCFHLHRAGGSGGRGPPARRRRRVFSRLKQLT